MILLIKLLTLQSFAAIISLIGAAIVISVVIFLFASTRTEEDKTSVKKKVYKVRARYFFGLVIVVIALLIISLRTLPYPSFQGEPDEKVTVVAKQWLWEMAPGTYNDSREGFAGLNNITLPVNKQIEFIVTSADVNHNFAIYNDKGVLLTQVQAMPGYNNGLQYKFTETGEYSLLCLEYCGVAHGFMMGKIHVN